MLTCVTTHISLLCCKSRVVHGHSIHQCHDNADHIQQKAAWLSLSVEPPLSAEFLCALNSFYTCSVQLPLSTEFVPGPGCISCTTLQAMH